MMNRQQRHFYMLGEPGPVAISLRTGKLMTITEFLTIGNSIGYADYQAIAVFLSRLDAEICRQYLNQQFDRGRRNEYALIKCRDDRVRILEHVGAFSLTLISGFHVDALTGRLLIEGGCYSLTHALLHAEDVQWLLHKSQGKSPKTIAAIEAKFEEAGESAYLDELHAIEAVETADMANIAKRAVHQIGTTRNVSGKVQVVYSPRRQAWIIPPLGDRNGV